MFQGFTDQAREVMTLAQEEARRSRHPEIGPEHILLGILREGSGAGAAVLTNLGVSFTAVRQEADKLPAAGPYGGPPPSLRQTPAAKKAIESAIEEARCLGHRSADTGHILLGLLREREGAVARILGNLGLRPEDARRGVLQLLAAGSGQGAHDGHASDTDDSGGSGAGLNAPGYRDLAVWQKTDELARQVYTLTSQFPEERIAGLAARLREVALSIPPRIAEAHVRQTTGAAWWFVEMASASVRELRYLLDFARPLVYLKAEDSRSVEALADEVERLLRTLSASLAQRPRSPAPEPEPGRQRRPARTRTSWSAPQAMDNS
jgi:four helix bundle protein